jgi:hypothetical protein
MNEQPGDFFLDPSVSVVSPAALSAFGAALPHARLKELLRLWEGRLLRCADVGLTNHATGSEFRAAGVAAVLGGEIVVLDGEATLPVPANHPAVYLVAKAAAHPLDPTDPAGLRVRAAEGQLTHQPAKGPSLQLARLNWTTNPQLPERREGTVDPLWWPKLALVSSHPLSLKAVGLLDDLLPDATSALLSLLESARRGDVGWWALLPELFRHAEGCAQDDPERLADLRATARRPDSAGAVAGLVRLIRDEGASLLAPKIPHEGRTYRLVRPLRPVTVTSRASEGRAESEAAFAAPGQAGALALTIAGPDDAYYDVTLSGVGQTLEFVRRGGQATEHLSPVGPGALPRLTLKGSGDTAPPWALGLYSEAPRS